MTNSAQRPTLNSKLHELGAYAAELTRNSSLALYDNQSTELILTGSGSRKNRLVLYFIGLGIPTLILAYTAQIYIGDETVMGFVFVGWCVSMVIVPMTIAETGRGPKSSLFLAQKELHSTQVTAKVKPRKVHISKIQQVVCRTRLSYWTLQHRYEYWVVFTEPYARENQGKNGFSRLEGKLAFQVFIIRSSVWMPQAGNRKEFEGLTLVLNEWLKLHAKHAIDFRTI
jgi:hypothetical protein